MMTNCSKKGYGCKYIWGINQTVVHSGFPRC